MEDIVNLGGTSAISDRGFVLPRNIEQLQVQRALYTLIQGKNEAGVVDIGLGLRIRVTCEYVVCTVVLYCRTKIKSEVGGSRDVGVCSARTIQTPETTFPSQYLRTHPHLSSSILPPPLLVV